MISTKKKKGAIKPPTEDEWEAHKQVLRGLYFNSTLSKLMQQMEEVHSFFASKNQYERKFKEWNFRKNLTVEEREHVLRKKRKRDHEGKETRVVLHGVEIPNKRLKKEESRFTVSDLNILYSTYPNAPTPEGISVSTPAALINPLWRKVRTDNLPSLRLGNLFANYFSSSQFSTSRGLGDSEKSMRNQALGSPIFFRPLPAIPSMSAELIDRMLGSSTDVSISSSVRAHNSMLQHFRNATLERYEGEAEARVAKLFGPSNDGAVQEFMTLFAQLGSNNMLKWSQANEILDWISKQDERFLESLFELQDAAVQACLESLVNAAGRKRNKQAFKAVLDADKYQQLFRGRREFLLYQAISMDLTALVETLIGEGIDVNTKVVDNKYRARTLLGAAVKVDIAKMLIDAGADLNAPIRGTDCYAPIYYAACDGNSELFRLFLDEGAHFNTADFRIRLPCRPQSVLACAIEKRNIEVVNMLLGLGVECVDSLRWFWSDFGTMVLRTELQQACYLGEGEIVKAVLNTPSGYHCLRQGRYRWAPLRDAAMDGHLDIVEMLLDAGADINATSQHCEQAGCKLQCIPSTALMAAVEAGHINVVKMLLDHEADIDAIAVGKHGTDILAVAEVLRHHEIASMLRRAGATSLEADLQNLRVQIQFAASRNDMPRVQQILALGLGVDPRDILDCPEIVHQKADEDSKTNVLSTFMAVCGCELNARGPRTGLSAVELAIDTGDVAFIRKFGNAGADFSKNTFRGEPLLHRAIGEVGDTDLEFIQLLLDYGAEINAFAMDEKGATVLQVAVSTRSIELTQLLLDRGADINAFAIDREHATALQVAVSTGSIELTQLLLDRGADINAPASDHDGNTAFQFAMLEKSNIELIQLLLNRGADVNAPAAPFNGRTALQAAIDSEYESPSHEHIQILIDNGADINAPPATYSGMTALQAAAIFGHLKIALTLLELGADPNALGSLRDGRTALEGAAEHGRLDMVQLLLNAGAEPSLTAVAFAEIEHHFVIADIIKAAMGDEAVDKGKHKEVECDDLA
ncbi:ankyrin repeat-containing domain protein [Leptodontidium sp. MPI-SDFR-AT-0119]|nr:ankyrin repeat-containing domain protein [Leptodontidium sp. MPI-SDFR-AT-0119]